MPSSAPFESITPAHSYPSLDEARQALSAVGRSIQSNGLPAGISPFVIGIAGYGHVASGVRELLNELPITEVEPDELASLRPHDVAHSLVQVTFKEQHIVEPADPRHHFELRDYYDQLERYRSVFARHLPRLTVLLNCNYWDQRYPRLITRTELREHFCGDQPTRLKVIGDLACDIDGSIECTVTATDPGDPVYTYDPASGTSRGASRALARSSSPSTSCRPSCPATPPTRSATRSPPSSRHSARPSSTSPSRSSSLPAEMRRAVIMHRGRFTPEFVRLQAFLDGR